ncbi:MAG TPA: YdcF family protein [Bacteriovoracaceae bacterium]|nr:YdcF family protein [Bacteriovoracaceae bacterium]
MFNRKYVFETKSTRLHRLLLGGASVSAIAFALTVTFIVYIPIYAKMQKGRAAGAFYQKSPDAIAVFTGDKGRISYALEILKKNPSTKLFISGVYAANSVQTLIEKQPNPIEDQDVASVQVDLDYESKNTFQNVHETVQFLKQNPKINNVLIISSDYHIMRVRFILSHFFKTPTPEFYFDSVVHDYSSWDNIRKLLKEAVKIGRTFFMLKILREEMVTE